MARDDTVENIKTLIQNTTEDVLWEATIVSTNIALGTVDVSIKGSGVLVKDIKVLEAVAMNSITKGATCLIVKEAGGRYVCLGTYSPNKAKKAGAEAGSILGIPVVKSVASDGYVLVYDSDNKQISLGDVDFSSHYIWLSPMQFCATLGTPSLSTIGHASSVRGPSWLLGDSSSEAIGTHIPVLCATSGSTIYVDVYWAMESATSGNVYVTAWATAVANGESMVTYGAGRGGPVAVPGTAKYLQKTTITLSHGYEYGDLLRINVTRLGSQESDTAVGDLHVCGVGVRFA